MKSKQALIILMVIFALLVVSCGGSDTASLVATGVAQTQQISALETAAAGGGAAPADSGEMPQTVPMQQIGALRLP